MTIALSIAALLVLVILHELGHFLAAKKFGVKVEEFGIGFPPRLLGKKFGETVYSLNALPLGAFVKMEGEEQRSDSPRSFNRKPLWQRFVIVGAGVVAFWIMGAVILGTLGATTGIPAAITDEEEDPGARVQVIGVAPDSPASVAGLRPGDEILRIGEEEIRKVGQVQELAGEFAGTELALEIRRAGEGVSELSLVPRSDPPADQGAMGVALARIGKISYPWYEAPIQGVRLTAEITWTILATFGVLISQLVQGEGVPAGMQVTGPVGIVQMMGSSVSAGIAQFGYLVALISIYLAIFNTLPVPALDGGRMLFLAIEGIRRKPLEERIEKNAIAVSFFLLIGLLIWITINDIL